MSKKYFDKVLIANRGEIAVRVMKTCSRLGIKTVAVHSTADENAKFVRMADEAVCIGPPASSESYLRVDRVLDAVKKTGANAVHPGYGFLSENAQFSGALKKAGVVFIGPDQEAIDAMGDKIHSKKLATDAKVNVIPGFQGEIRDDKHCLEVCHEIGYPVMIKASSGGGGKGMRLANTDEEAIEYLKLCQEEAKASFNDDRMLVEKFVSNPKHIEIQVIADRHGNVVYLPERECSIQRRNQKVIEEAPSAFIDRATWKQMGEQAARLAAAVKYVTAGTVEMMVDGNRHFYFLEMNTRLQVEHPITDAVTGVDLVEEMLRASAGLELSVKQSDIKVNGWATECRVYAEDPLQNYFPSIGRLSAYVEPTHVPGVRVDSGILEGSQISVYYDPLIAKLITWGKDRNESLDRMTQALDSYTIRGVRHNICLLREVINEKKYRATDFTTQYLAKEFPGGFDGHKLNADEAKFLSTAASIMRAKRDVLNGDKTPSQEYLVRIVGPAKQGQVHEGEVVVKAENGKFLCDNKAYNAEWTVGTPCMQLTPEGAKEATIFQYMGCNDKLTFSIQYMGSPYEVQVLTKQQAGLTQFMAPPATLDLERLIVSPMPGAVVGIHAQVGDKVVAGQDVITLEAMKMRNKLKSPKKGVITKINVKVGGTVDDGAVMVEIGDEEAPKAEEEKGRNF